MLSEEIEITINRSHYNQTIKLCKNHHIKIKIIKINIKIQLS